MDTSLHLAAKENDIETIERILADQGAFKEPHKPGLNHATPLHWSAGCGHLEATKILLQHGASVNERNIFGRTPLDNAATGGHEAVVRLLLEAGAGLGKVTPQDRNITGAVAELLTYAQSIQQRSDLRAIRRCKDCLRLEDDLQSALDVAAEVPGLQETIRDLQSELAATTGALKKAQRRLAELDALRTGQQERTARDLTSMARTVADIAPPDVTPRGRPYIVSPGWIPKGSGRIRPVEATPGHAIVRMCEGLLKNRGGVGVALLSVDVIVVTPEEVSTFEEATKELTTPSPSTPSLDVSLLVRFMQQCLPPSRGPPLLGGTLQPALVYVFAPTETDTATSLHVGHAAARAAETSRRPSDGAIPVVLLTASVRVGSLTGENLFVSEGHGGGISLDVTNQSVGRTLPVAILWIKM